MPTWATRKAAKFWVTGVATVVAAVLVAAPESPQWLFVVNAALAALGVYLVPNAEAPTGEPSAPEDKW